ncbi:S1C family serine protease [Rhodopirellula sp. SWK7]|uniref:S1C family serine protease n=1 Tax=Rhodopirellula sp. SWK7 TaxID=595460 RepID=UPI0002BDED8F|nr:Peptidase S1 and S6, chymotrypsin/Hap domain protein [Rhodopirellula sp. SWK7]
MAPMRDDTPPNPRDLTLDTAIEPRELVSFRLKVPVPETGPLISCEGILDQVTPPPIASSSPPAASEPDSQPNLDASTESLEVEINASPADSPNVQEEEKETPVAAKVSPNPIIQSMTLIASMIVMLLIARFSVPRIVEEIRYSWHRGELRAEYETGGEGLKNVSLDSLSRAYEMVTSRIGPSVVHIEVQRKPAPNEEQMHRLLGGEMFGMSDQGSGVVVDADGYILTNRHVIADGESISITLGDGRRLPAEVVGTDSLTDLAVLKIEADRLMPIKWGDSDSLRVGSPVWAVGSPFGLDRTVTFGILSGKHRWVRAGEQHGASGRYQDFMQSDVAVNPGNSGGPLVDAKGSLVGINTAIVGDTYQGVSFSIPSNLSRQVYESIRTTGRVQRGYLGVSLQEVPDDLLASENTRVRGALVTGIAGDASPAGVAGVVAGDVVRRADGVDILDVGHLMRIVGKAGAGASIVLDVRRDEEDLQVTVVLGSRPFELDR